MHKEKTSSGRLEGKVALITGVARPRNIGSSIARKFAREGADLIVADLSDQVFEREEELKNMGGEVKGYKVDLSRRQEVNKMVEEAAGRFKKIDILANVAGKSVPPRPPFLDMSPEYWQTVMDRNLMTTVNCCWAVLPGMVTQKYGKVVNISSITGTKTAYRFCAAYAASKGAVSALTRALALEMGEHNITVNAILPGDIDTGDEPWRPEDGRRDLGRLHPPVTPPVTRPGSGDEVADLALFLSTDESQFITGTEILIDGGLVIVEPIIGDPL
jgi:NAD(P)-dependent dehydrogenase (short-subunit alcohol dehydrogenase family)